MAETSASPGASRRKVVVGLGSATLAAAAAIATPRRPLAFSQGVALSDLAPMQVGPWRQTTGSQEVIAERVEEAERADRTLLFTYGGRGVADVMVAISYHSPLSDDIKVHRPEVCYRSAGFQLSSEQDAPLLLSPRLVVPARRFTADRGSRHEEVLYWTRIARAFPTTAVQQRLATIALGLQGRSVDGLLMRFSTLDGKQTPVQKTLAPFAAALFGAVGRPARTLMIGDRKHA